MNVVERLQREFQYNAWANRESLRSLQRARAVPPRAAEVMAHVVGAEALWLRRLGQSSPELPVWPMLALSECVALLEILSSAWALYLANIVAVELDRDVAYVNSRGESWSNTVADILTHVTLHSSYHRGQIATLLGRSGEPSVLTDFIECVRRGYLKGS